MSSQPKVSAVNMSKSKALFLRELREAIGELNDALVGKTKANNAYDFLDLLEASERRSEPTRPFEDVKNEILTGRRNA